MNASYHLVSPLKLTDRQLPSTFDEPLHAPRLLGSVVEQDTRICSPEEPFIWKTALGVQSGVVQFEYDGASCRLISAKDTHDTKCSEHAPEVYSFTG
jgi:hypothetical protein